RRPLLYPTELRARLPHLSVRAALPRREWSGQYSGGGLEAGAEGHFADFVDLVAEFRRLLEFEVAGVLVHVLFHLREQLLAPRIRHALVFGPLLGRLRQRAGLGAVLAVGGFHDVHHGLADALRGDAVRLVVRLLL